MEYSFPVVNEPMSAEQWSSVTLGLGNGVLDPGDGPYGLVNLDNATNTGTITTGTNGFAHSILAGFYHKIDADVVVDLPAVSTPTTYSIALQYDPARVIGDLPVRLGVFTDELDRTQNKKYMVLYEIDRKPDQLLTATTRRAVRPRIAPTIIYGYTRNLPDPNDVMWGTRALCHNDFAAGQIEEYMAIPGPEPRWHPVYQQDDRFVWEPKSDDTAWHSPAADGYQRAIGRSGKKRRLRGRCELKSGLSLEPRTRYSSVFGAGLAVEDRPPVKISFTTAISNSSAGDADAVARIEINPEGEVLGWVGRATKWIGLDGVEWEVD